MIKQKGNSDCPIHFTLGTFGDKWTFLIVRDLLFKGKHYYGEFLKSDEKIATNILANRLSLLEKQGIIVKKEDPLHGSKFIYQLSKKGNDLLPILKEMTRWGVKYDKPQVNDGRTAKRRRLV